MTDAGWPDMRVGGTPRHAARGGASGADTPDHWTVRAAIAGAHRCHEGGDPQAALAALEPILATAEPDGMLPSDEIAAAATLYAGLLVETGRAAAALPRARASHRTLVGSRDFWSPAAMRAAAVVACATARVGDATGAVTVYIELLDRMRAWYGPDHAHTLACQADLATTMHAAGDCGAGRQMLADAYARCRDRFGPGDRMGLRMLARLAILTRECSDFDAAHRHFRTARDLAHAHLGRDDPLSMAIVRSARDGPAAGHSCPSAAIDRSHDRPVPSGAGPEGHVTHGLLPMQPTSQATFGRRRRDQGS